MTGLGAGFARDEKYLKIWFRFDQCPGQLIAVASGQRDRSQKQVDLAAILLPHVLGSPVIPGFQDPVARHPKRDADRLAERRIGIHDEYRWPYIIGHLFAGTFPPDLRLRQPADKD